MPRSLVLLLSIGLAACGGGGGGGGGAPGEPIATTARLDAASAELAPNATVTEIVVRLAGAPAAAPCLLELAVELPPALTLPPTERLAAIAPLATLDGDFVGERFVVLCGDAVNRDATALAIGPLFRLRVSASTPRLVGTHSLQLRPLRAATRDGAEVPVETAPTRVDVLVR